MMWGKRAATRLNHAIGKEFRNMFFLSRLFELGCNSKDEDEKGMLLGLKEWCGNGTLGWETRGFVKQSCIFLNKLLDFNQE